MGFENEKSLALAHCPQTFAYRKRTWGVIFSFGVGS
jgi:hypothetical protein